MPKNARIPGYCIAAISFAKDSLYWWTIPIAIKSPVPEVSAPKESAKKLITAMIIPFIITSVGI